MTAMNFVYPSAAAMERILPDLYARSAAERVGLQIFPIVTEDTYFVRWIQADNYYGLQQMRGLDGQPPKVTRTGEATYVYEPGVYGEHTEITERELLTRAIPGRPEIPIPIDDLVARDDNLLMQRELDRMENNVWNLIGNGVLSITLPGPNGPQVYNDSYTIQNYTSLVPWNTSATAAPIIDFQSVQQLEVGHGVDLGAGATAYMNQYTANLMLNNANTADFAGKRNQFGATLNDVGAMSNYFQGQNLPKIKVYDKGFQLIPLTGPITNVNTQFQKFIPNHRVIVVGARPGNSPVGNVKQTVQAMQPGGGLRSGPYRYITDSSRGLNTALKTPPLIQVHRGWNGGPVIFYPSAVVSMTV